MCSTGAPELQKEGLPPGSAPLGTLPGHPSVGDTPAGAGGQGAQQPQAGPPLPVQLPPRVGACTGSVHTPLQPRPAASWGEEHPGPGSRTRLSPQSRDRPTARPPGVQMDQLRATKVPAPLCSRAGSRPTLPSAVPAPRRMLSAVCLEPSGQRGICGQTPPTADTRACTHTHTQGCARGHTCTRFTRTSMRANRSKKRPEQARGLTDFPILYMGEKTDSELLPG